MDKIMPPFAMQSVSVDVKYNFFDLEEIEMSPEEVVLDLTEAFAVNDLQIIVNTAVVQNPEYYDKLPESLARCSYIRTTFFAAAGLLSLAEAKARNLLPSIERYNRICELLKEGERIVFE